MPDLATEGQAALAALDAALAARPARDAAAFTEATERLCAIRTLLIAECRAGATRQRHLEQLNAVLSSTLAGHYPLGPVPWTLVEVARKSLRDLLAVAAGEMVP